MQLTMSSASSSLRSITSCTSSSVAPTIASASFSSTVIAPLSALSLTRRDSSIRAAARPVRRALPAAAPAATRRLRLRGAAQPLHLASRQPAALAEAEAAQPERPERHPLERR